MKAKEKAEELVNNFINTESCFNKMQVIDGIKCAIICVDELLDYCSSIDDHHGISDWGEVKKELHKL